MKNMLDELKKLDEDVEVPKDFRKNVMKNIRQIDEENRKLRKKRHFTKYIIPYISSAAIICIAVLVGFKNSANKDINMASIRQEKMEFATDLNDNTMISGFSENSFAPNNLNNSEADLTSRTQNDIADMKKDKLSNYVESDMTSDDMQSTSHNTIAPESAMKVPANDFIENICEILKNNDLEVVHKDTNYILVNAKIEEVERLLEDDTLNVLITSENGLVKIEEKIN